MCLEENTGAYLHVGVSEDVSFRNSRRVSVSQKDAFRGVWVAQTAKRLTLGFSSGRDLAVREFEPHTGLRTDSAETAWDSLSLSAPPPLALSVSLSKIKKSFKKTHSQSLSLH